MYELWLRRRLFLAACLSVLVDLPKHRLAAYIQAVVGSVGPLFLGQGNGAWRKCKVIVIAMAWWACHVLSIEWQSLWYIRLGEYSSGKKYSTWTQRVKLPR